MLFSFKLFADKVFLLLKGKVPATELIFTNPSESIVSVIELTLAGGKCDMGMFLYDAETVVSVDDYAIPYDNWVDDNSVAKMFSSSCWNSSTVSGGILLSNSGSILKFIVSSYTLCTEANRRSCPLP